MEGLEGSWYLGTLLIVTPLSSARLTLPAQPRHLESGWSQGRFCQRMKHQGCLERWSLNLGTGQTEISLVGHCPSADGDWNLGLCRLELGESNIFPSVSCLFPQPQSQRQEKGGRRNRWMHRNTGRDQRGRQGIWAREVMGERDWTPESLRAPGEVESGGTNCPGLGWVAVGRASTVYVLSSLDT